MTKHTATKRTIIGPKASAFVAICYEHAVLRTHAEVGLPLRPWDRSRLDELRAMLTDPSQAKKPLRLFPTSLRVRLETPSASQRGWVVGVTGTGAIVSSPVGFRPGAWIAMRLTGERGDEIALGCRVLWSNDNYDGSSSTGLSFSPVPVSREAIAEIRSFGARAHEPGAHGTAATHSLAYRLPWTISKTSPGTHAQATARTTLRSRSARGLHGRRERAHQPVPQMDAMR